MGFVTSLVIGVGLAMDAFAVSLGVGAADKARDRRAKFRLAFHFGIFQTGMTLLGWLLGSTVANLVSGVQGWIALVLLGYVGINMVRSGCNPDCDSYQNEPSKGRTLVILCIATSLDAMAVGLSMAVMKAQVIYPSLVIGVVTTSLSVFGLLAGAQLNHTFGKRMEILGGLLLVGIGLRVAFGAIL